jgi:hypothetical protein
MSGLIDMTEEENSPDPMVRALARKAVEVSDAIRARMAPPGALKLPKLLEARRQEYGIVDGAFKMQCAYERVLVWQIARETGKKFEGTGLFMPDTVATRSQREASIGVIVGAGLRALDILHSNGMALGHIVQMIRNAPWRIKVDAIAGHEFHLIVLNAGDLLGSEDLATELLAGEAKVVPEMNEHGVTEHCILRDGAIEKPQTPWMSEDF